MLILTKILVTGLLGLIGSAGDGGDPLKIKPIQTMAGGDTKIDFPMVRIIQNPKAWRELWAMHKGLPIAPENADKPVDDPIKPPTVDFDKNQVLIVFGGHLPNVQAYEYVKTFAKDDTAIVQIGQNMIPASAVKDMMHPFIMLVVPREPVAIEVQLDEVAKDGSHYWKTLAAYRAPKDTKTGG
jgi:hypothetical protein